VKEVKEKRWIRGSRIDRVVENRRTYYKICKCGIEKESYKMPMCNACTKDYYINKRSKTNIVIKDLVVKGKKDITLPIETAGTKYYKKLLFDFVNRIERRNGLASLEDIFVDMITLFNYYGCNQDIDKLPTNLQLKAIWDFLRDYKKKMELKELIKK
jgi:hypothetical protein